MPWSNIEETLPTLDLETEHLETALDFLKYAEGKDTSEDFDTLWQAAFRQNSSFHNLDLLSINAAFNRVEDPDFNLSEAIEQDAFAAQIPDRFEDADSLAEFYWIRSKIIRELSDRKRLDKAGLKGLTYQIGAGLVSPEMFIPGGQAVVGGRLAWTAGKAAVPVLKTIGQTAARMAGWSAVAATAYEGTELAAKETSTLTDSAVGIGSATVLGAFLGAGVGGYVSKKAIGNVKKLADDLDAEGDFSMLSQKDMLVYPGDAVPLGPEEGLQVEPGILGSIYQKVKGSKSPAAFDNISPNLRLINQQDSATMASMAHKLDAGGLAVLNRETGAREIAEGGSVWQLKKAFVGRVHSSVMPLVTNAKVALTKKGYKFQNPLSKNKEISELMYRAIDRPSEHPEINALAEEYRKVFRHMIKEVRRYEGDWEKRWTDDFGVQPNEEGVVEAFTPFELFKDLSDDEIIKSFTRFPNAAAINGDRQGFVGILKEHLIEAETKRIEKLRSNVEAKVGRAEEEIAQREMPDNVAEEQIKDLNQQMANLGEELGMEDVIDARNFLTQMARQAGDDTERAAYYKKRDALDREHTGKFMQLDSRKKEIRSGLRALGKTAAGVRTRRDKLLKQMEKKEELYKKDVDSFLTRGSDILGRLGRHSELEEEKLVKDLEEQRDALIKRIGPAYGETTAGSRLDATSRRASKFPERRERAQQALADIKNAFTTRSQNRAVAINKLRTRVAGVDPEEAKIMADRKRGEIKDRMEAFDRQVAAIGERGNIETTYENGFIKNLDEAMYAKARHIANSMDSHHNMGVAQAIQSFVSRKSLPDFVKIDPDRVWSNGKSLYDFLEKDAIQTLLRAGEGLYGDTQIYRAFGSVDPLQVNSPFRRQIMNEFEIAREKAELAGEDPTKVNIRQKRRMDDLSRMIRRTRNLEGIPADPAGLGHQMGAWARTWGLYKAGGGIVTSALVDIGRVPAQYGMNGTFKPLYQGLWNGFKNIKMSKEEAQWAGTVVELTEPVRARTLYDSFQDFQSGARYEKGRIMVNNLSGRVLLYDYQNQGFKAISSGFAVADLNRSLMMLAGKTPATKRQKARAEFVLAKLNINDVWAERILNQLYNTPDGGVQVKGVEDMLFPNTGNWTDLDAVDVYRAAITQQVDDTILTPGLELWRAFDSENPFVRMMMQFRRFAMSSISKTWRAWGQNAKYQPVGVMTGALTHLGIGLGLVYLKAFIAGKAIDQITWDEARDKAIDYSGLLTMLGEPRQFLGQQAMLSDAVTFSGQSQLRGTNRSIVDQIFGISMGTARGGEKLFYGVGDPNKSHVSTVRQMLPLQNHILFQRALTEMEISLKRKQAARNL